MMGKSFVSYAIDELKVTKWAILAVNDDYGSCSMDAIDKLIKKHGGSEIVTVEYNEKGATDYYEWVSGLHGLLPNR